jgi:hypothetical protein
MTQGVLPFKIVEQEKKTGATALAGLPLYLELAEVIGLSRSIRKHIKVRDRGAEGWTDSQIILALVLLNVAGGDCVEDIEQLEKDEGFGRILRKSEHAGLGRKVRRAIEQRWRKERRRNLPSRTAIFRYLDKFHDPKQEKLRCAGEAFIPESNEHLRGFVEVNKDSMAFVQERSPERNATLDMDATLVETSKDEALYCYKHFKAYQPLNVWWAEQQLLLYTEFRDGNVPAQTENLRVLRAAIACLPPGVEKVRMRSDTAGYQWDLLRYCDNPDPGTPGGRIEFTVSSDVSPAFKRAVAEVSATEWHPLRRWVHGHWEKTGKEWAEVCFVPQELGRKKHGCEFRYLAIREALERQPALPGLCEQPALPFPTMEWAGKSYKVFGIVTNMDWEGEKLIHWHHERCGKSEEAHSVMKEDFAGGKLPSAKFGVNASWWWIMILAFNLNAVMKRLALGEGWANKRMKAIRFHLIQLPGWVKERARQLELRLSRCHAQVLLAVRRRIAMLLPVPAG